RTAIGGPAPSPKVIVVPLALVTLSLPCRISRVISARNSRSIVLVRSAPWTTARRAGGSREPAKAMRGCAKGARRRSAASAALSGTKFGPIYRWLGEGASEHWSLSANTLRGPPWNQRSGSWDRLATCCQLARRDLVRCSITHGMLWGL